MLEGLRKPTELIVIVVTLLAYGCPVQAIVKAFGLDERTVACWRDRAGAQCQRVQEAVMQSGKLSLTHVPADEIRVKTRAGVMWMGLALLIESRLWIAGVVQQSRDRSLADRLLRQVRACAHSLSQVLVCVDGWGGVSQGHCAGLSGTSENISGKRAMLLASLAAPAHRASHQKATQASDGRSQTHALTRVYEKVVGGQATRRDRCFQKSS